VVAITATGVFAAWRQIGLSWGALTTTAYGKLVLYKVAGLVVLVAVASISRTAVHGGLAVPGRRRSPSRRPVEPETVPTTGDDGEAVVAVVDTAAPVAVTAGAPVTVSDAVASVASPSGVLAPAAGASTADAPSPTRRRSPAAEPGVLTGWLFGRRAARLAPGQTPPASAPPASPDSSGAAAAPRATARVEPATGAVPTHRLRTAIALEIAVILAVLAVTAVLVNARPAKEAFSAPFSTEVKAGPTLVNVVVDPAKAGPLTIHLYVLTPTGLIDNVPEVDATMSNRAAGISGLRVPLQVGGPGHFLTSGFNIPISGVWTMSILVRTDNIDDYFADPITVHIR
jgi:copper transport protein